MYQQRKRMTFKAVPVTQVFICHRISMFLSSDKCYHFLKQTGLFLNWSICNSNMFINKDE